MENQPENQEERTITLSMLMGHLGKFLGSLLMYLVGFSVIFGSFMIGIFNRIETSLNIVQRLPSFLLILTGGLLIFPPSMNLIQKKYKINFTKQFRFFVGFGMYALGFSLLIIFGEPFSNNEITSKISEEEVIVKSSNQALNTQQNVNPIISRCSQLNYKSSIESFELYLKNSKTVDTKTKIESMNKLDLEYAGCIFLDENLIFSAPHKTQFFSYLIRAEMFTELEYFSKKYYLDELAFNLIIKEANAYLDKYQKSNVTDWNLKNAKKIREIAKDYVNDPSKLSQLDNRIEYLRPAGSGREAYELCKDKVKMRLHDPGSAEFQFGFFELLGSSLMFGGVCDIVNDKECIVKVDSWVRARNAFGAMRVTPFKCHVRFDKKTDSGSVILLNM